MAFSTKQESGLPLKVGPFTVSEANDVSRSEWNGWVEGLPGGQHYLQSHEWGEFKRGYGWRPVRLTLEQEGRVVGVGQFLVYDTPLVPGSLMYCPKGPCLPWEDEEAVRAFFRGAVAAAKRHGAHTLKIEPEVREEQERVKGSLAGLGFGRFRWDLNFKTMALVDLSRPEEEILAGMKGKTRYNTRLAEKKGVRVAEDNSPEAREHFWRMFEGTSERNGFWHRPRAYHLAGWRAMEDVGRAHLFFATHEGDRLAGILVYTFGRKYWYILGASTNEKRNLMPPYLLQWEVMRWAKSQGLECYDMMAVPSPNEVDENHPLYGVYRFKVGFGGGIADYIGCFDLPIRSVRAKLWNSIEPWYYRLYRKLKGDIYY